MTKQEFIRLVDKSLEELILYAELNADRKLPNSLHFEWAVKEPIPIEGRESIIQAIADKVFISENEIYPCVDLIVDSITVDQKLKIKGSVSGFNPRPLQVGWSNRPGPFIYGVNKKLISTKIDIKSKEFKNILISKRVLHQGKDNYKNGAQ